ncbi:MAG: hypothetical protein Q9209_003297 [Squamulea sp. 1 TL-2023]
MLSPDNLTPQTRLFLAMLSNLQQPQSLPPTSPPPPYSTPTAPFPSLTYTKPTPTPVLPSLIDDDDDNDVDSTRPPAPLQIHISAPTTITGSNNRLILPSPTHLSSLVSIAVKLALQGDEGGKMQEWEHEITVTVDAGTKIEGDGNVVVYHQGRKEKVGNETGSSSKKMVATCEVDRKRRASSEPIDVQRVMKRARS